MQPTNRLSYHSLIAVFAICALAGCAQFQNSFGEITDPDSSPAEYAAANPAESLSQENSDDPTEPLNSTDAHGERSFMYKGIKVQVSDGELSE